MDERRGVSGLQDLFQRNYCPVGCQSDCSIPGDCIGAVIDNSLM